MSFKHLLIFVFVHDTTRVKELVAVFRESETLNRVINNAVRTTVDRTTVVPINDVLTMVWETVVSRKSFL